MIDNHIAIQQDLEKETGIVLTNNFRVELAALVNHLINTDFENVSS
jgi:hypothetical protein